MKNKIKLTLDNFLVRIKREREDACGSGFLIGVLLTAWLVMTTLYIKQSSDFNDYGKRCNTIVAEWKVALKDVREESDRLKVQIRNEANDRRLFQGILFAKLTS
jgi:hypothetical protein